MWSVWPPPPSPELIEGERPLFLVWLPGGGDGDGDGDEGGGGGGGDGDEGGGGGGGDGDEGGGGWVTEKKAKRVVTISC